MRQGGGHGDGDLGGAGSGRGVDDDGVTGHCGVDDGLLVTVDVDDEEFFLRLPVRQRGDRFLQRSGNDVFTVGRSRGRDIGLLVCICVCV